MPRRSYCGLLDDAAFRCPGGALDGANRAIQGTEVSGLDAARALHLGEELWAPAVSALPVQSKAIRAQRQARSGHGRASSGQR
jgi:hypothetical protein